jgi:Reverse transcriptase (RNA-dependent DNA polymerase)/gag-polypeptide of LTR copia-type/GAG-pre-integrase domain
MGPESSSNMSSSKVVNLPRLSEDGSNWVTYKERVLNNLTSKGLMRHVRGTARKPVQLTERHGAYYRPHELSPLSDEDLEKHEDLVDSYDQKEAQVREIIYETVSKSVFLEIKDESSAAGVWTKLVAIHEAKGTMTYTDTLTKLSSARYTDGKSMRAHISTMKELRERLAEMGNPINDDQFSAYIRASLTPDYRPLLTSIMASSRTSGKTLSVHDLITFIYEEADNKTAEKNVDEAKENSAMVANKGKGKSKAKSDKYCDNCKKKGHTKENCFAKGGGKESEAPDWWKKKFRKDESKGTAANAAEKEEESVAFLAYTENFALAVTSDFQKEALATSGIPKRGTIIDCGASSHFSPEREKFLNYRELSPIPIRAADGRTFHALGKGDLKVLLPMGKDTKPTPVTLKDTYYSPQMAFTLISVTRMTNAGFSCTMKGKTCTVTNPSNKIIGRIPEIRGLYRVTDNTTTKTETESANTTSQLLTISQLHRIMGHINHDDLRKMVKEGIVEGINLDMDSKPEFCDVCVQAKATRKPFPKKSTSDRVKAYGDKVTADVWGPAQVESLGGKRYYNLFQDKHSHEERIYFMRNKSESLDYYKRHEAWVKVQRGAIIKVFGCDRGGEYTGKEFTNHLEHQGTVRHLTVHDSPASNGSSERANRTHLDIARAMIIQSGLPAFLWAEAIRHSVWLRNRTITRATPENKTPYEIGTKEKPDLSGLLEWGSRIWVKKLDVQKLEPRAFEAVFVGYDDESKGYRVFWPSKRHVSIERDVYFNKNEALLPDTAQIEGETDIRANSSGSTTSIPPKPIETITDSNSGTKELSNAPLNAQIDPKSSEIESSQSDTPKSPENQPKSTNTSFPHEKPIENEPKDVDDSQLGRGKRARKPEGYYKNLDKGGGGVTEANVAVSLNEEIDSGGVVTNLKEWFGDIIEEALVMSEDEPSLEEALKGDEAKEWVTAMREEITQIEKVHTYDIVEAPPDANIVPCRWVFRRKRDGEGKVVRHKARLVAKGFKQQFGVDYHETFAPTVRPATLRLLLAIAAQKGSVIVQADAKNAYLHGTLEPNEIIYMDLPPQYSLFHQIPANLTKKSPVCRLWRPLYGSKQGANRFRKFLVDVMTILGFTVCNADEAVFYKFSPDGSYIIVPTATDDFTIIADSNKSANNFQDELEKHLEIVRLGPISWLLGTTVERNMEKHTIKLGQEAFIGQIITRFGLEDARICSTPLNPNVDLTPGSDHVSPTLLSSSEKTTYREIVGSLMYLSVMTRPDITFAVSTLSQYLESPTTTHLIAVKRVIRYLKGTKHLRLTLGGHEINLSGYSDADWASQLHRHSISGFAMFIGSGAVSWSSKKQPIVTLSSTESEYVALTHSSKDIIWIRKLLFEFSSIISISSNAPSLFCDNQGAIRLSSDSTFHARTKHIDVHFHFIRQTVSQGHLTLHYIPTNDMIADIFTKSLAFNKFTKFRSLLGLQ